jgi:cytochrome c oxidase subunit III
MPQGTTVNPDVDMLMAAVSELVERSEPPPPSSPEPPFDGNGDDRDDRPEPPINNARLGVILFIGAEGMFFAGLLSAFLVFRTGSIVWPPPFQPRLPIVVTAVNTCILLWSSYTMYRALRAIRRGNAAGLVDWLRVTVLLGLIFLGVQGYEWGRLLQFGLTLSSSIYGATFYTIIGCHAAHVFGAVIWLLIILAMAKKQQFRPEHCVGVQVCGIYWYFVVALWPMLFGIVYLY